MVEIDNLEVAFDVEGDGDAAVFARLFARHIEDWSRRQERSRERRRSSDEERRLGDRPPPGARR